MLKMENVTYRYPDQTVALQNVNMDLGIASKIGIVGSNGAGKSTLFLIFTGFLKPTEGKIIWQNKPLCYGKKDLNNLRRAVGIVFQDPEKQIFFSRVYDDIAFGPRNLDKDPEEVNQIVETAIKQTQIHEVQDKPVHFLSGGQKKRVAIAGTIAMDSKLIFFDEPTSDLDFPSKQSIKSIIAQLALEGRTVVISSHDMDFIYETCDYIYVIKNGRVLSSGEPKIVFMDREILLEAGLEEPWLVKIHRYFGTDLLKDETQLFES